MESDPPSMESDPAPRMESDPAKHGIGSSPRMESDPAPHEIRSKPKPASDPRLNRNESKCAPAHLTSPPPHYARKFPAATLTVSRTPMTPRKPAQTAQTSLPGPQAAQTGPQDRLGEPPGPQAAQTGPSGKHVVCNTIIDNSMNLCSFLEMTIAKPRDESATEANSGD